MPNGNEITIKGGSLKIRYKRGDFNNAGDEDTHRDPNARISRITIDGTEYPSNERSEVVIYYDVSGTQP